MSAQRTVLFPFKAPKPLPNSSFHHIIQAPFRYSRSQPCSEIVSKVWWADELTWWWNVQTSLCHQLFSLFRNGLTSAVCVYLLLAMNKNGIWVKVRGRNVTPFMSLWFDKRFHACHDSLCAHHPQRNSSLVTPTPDGSTLPLNMSQL